MSANRATALANDALARESPMSKSVYPQTGRDAPAAECSRGRQSIVTDKTTTKVRTKVSGAGATP